MNSEKKGRDQRGSRSTTRGGDPGPAPFGRMSTADVYAVVFGAFLGLALLKFGNPAVLDESLSAPANLREAWQYAWPVHWAFWLLIPLALAGGVMASRSEWHWRAPVWLWTLPLLWMVWQCAASAATVDFKLTVQALCTFAGCLLGYFSGAILFSSRAARRWLLLGVIAAFAWCLVRAGNQKLVEFPNERQMLKEGSSTGWTNATPEFLLELKHDHVVITTNGVDVVNPVIMAKYEKGRVMGTLVYPNALAGAILLLWPVCIVLAFDGTRRFRRLSRTVVIGTTLFLGGASLIWTGSKFGWLIAVAMAGVAILRRPGSKRFKYGLTAAVMVLGALVFIWRFHGYLAAGATSAGARFDYWRAAIVTARDHPWLGTGPGTFQRPYERLKAPSSEMARLAHNDYLEQFCDSGIPGGLSYLVWIGAALVFVGRRGWNSEALLDFGIFLGLMGWYLQGLGEFGLYVPALAWTAFTLLGCMVGLNGQRKVSFKIDNPGVHG